MKKISLLLLHVFIVSISFGQTTDVWTHFKEKFSDEPAVFVERSEVLNILIDGDSLKVYSDVLEDILHLKEQSDAFSNKRVYGSHFSQVENIKAKTLIWEKNKYKEMLVSDYKKNNERASGIFYDDSYYYTFNFPSVASRNRTQLQYRENLKDAKFIGGFIIASYMPQGKASYTIKTTKDVELAFEVLHDTKKEVKFKKTEKGNSVTYEWTAENVSAFKRDEGSPAIRYYAPHIVCYVKSYTTKKGKINVLSNLDDLYRWYYTFVKDLNKEQAPELVSVVEKIKATSKTEMDVVKNVFYWVQDNIRYIAFEQGMRGLIPHNGSYVCEKRYGDCKDMANIIVNMLALADVKAFHTWIGSRDIPYRYSELPTPLVDNHMIATYIGKDGQYYFLDATSNYTPFGYPSSMIQGKEALIGFDATRFEVKEVPIMDKSKNLMIDSVTVKLEDNMMVGSGKSSLRGYAKVFGGYELDRVDEDDAKKYVTRLVNKGSNKFFLDDYSIANLDNRDTPTRISYTFRVGDYFQKLGDEIYVNLNLKKSYYNDFITSSRSNPKESEYTYDEYEVTELTIPLGYTVEYLPPNATHMGKLMGYEINYTALPGKVVYTKKLYTNYLLMLPEQFEQWNDAVKQISEAYKESIILKKK